MCGKLITTLWQYVKLAGCEIEDILEDQREIAFPAGKVITPSEGKGARIACVEERLANIFPVAMPDRSCDHLVICT